MRLNESTVGEVVQFLMSDEIFDYIDTTDCQGACNVVIDLCQERFENIALPEVARVQVVNVAEGSYDIVDSDYYVVKYNGRFYDYCAYDYFNDVFKITEIPVIQPILNTFNLIHSTVSTVKNYVLVGE